MAIFNIVGFFFYTEISAGFEEKDINCSNPDKFKQLVFFLVFRIFLSILNLRDLWPIINLKFSSVETFCVSHIWSTLE